MENKLLELKEQFCKWYCSGRNTIVDIELICNVEDSECSIDCNNPIEICEFCKVPEYIKFARDELK